MKLATRIMGDGAPLIVLHGLFGSGDNWQSLAKLWSESFQVILVDQRNHGRSPRSDNFNYDLLAADLFDLYSDLKIEKAALIGHSMGGKAVLRFSQLHPEKVEKAVVVDMGLKAYPLQHSDVLDAFHAVDLYKVRARSDAEAMVAAHLPNVGTAQFILKNLYRMPDGNYAWRVNFGVMEAEMEHIVAAIPPETSNVEVLFIYGSNSDYVLPSDFESIKKIFTRAKFAQLPTGHWVHAEDPDGLNRLFKKFVTS